MHLKRDSLRFAKRAVLLVVLILPSFALGQTRGVNATIDASKSDAPISKYIYGQFLEHIGGIVNSNIWAEMLDDRKFYFPINSHPPAEPPGPAFRRTALRHWMPIGADEFVTMDADHPYVGEHTPLVKLSSSEAHGIQQAGLGRAQRQILHGPRCSGRHTWHDSKGHPGLGKCARVIAKRVVINKVGPEYRKFPLNFQAQGDSDDARLEIAGTGTGSFHVGAVSLMPANNIKAFARKSSPR